MLISLQKIWKELQPNGMRMKLSYHLTNPMTSFRVQELRSDLSHTFSRLTAHSRRNKKHKLNGLLSLRLEQESLMIKPIKSNSTAPNFREQASTSLPKLPYIYLLTITPLSI